MAQFSHIWRRHLALPASLILAFSMMGQSSCPSEPCEEDIDGDGVCDVEDICLGWDDNEDADFDGIPDGCDPCPVSVDNADTDGDGICDYEDACPEGENTDTDGDGICDYEDACPEGENTDTDGDGICDYEDACPEGENTDADADGICDYEDACPEGENTDADGDGICDYEDACPNGDNTDTDGDGICDYEDACPTGENTDTDGDGVCDYEDICPEDPADLCGDCEAAVDVSQGTTDVTAGINGDYLGQSFTAQADGLLTAVAVQLRSNGGGTLEIYRGGILSLSPSGPLESSTAITFVDTSELQVFTLATPVAVSAGEVLTWKIQSPEWVNADICSADCYPGGHALAYTGYDQVFETYVAPFSCETCEDQVDHSQTQEDVYPSFNVDFYGQSFVINETGELAALGIEINSAGQGVLRIYQGGISSVYPAGPLIHEQTAGWAASTDMQAFSLDAPLPVIAGEVYTWQLYTGASLNGPVCQNCDPTGRSLAYDGYDHVYETIVNVCE